MEEDETLDPMNVDLLCSVAIMPRADRLADLLQELWLSSGRKLANGIIQSAVDHRKGTVSRRVCVDVIHNGAPCDAASLSDYMVDPSYPPVNVDSARRFQRARD